jgi:hypothetical protein
MPGDEIGYVGFAHQQGAENMVIDFQCRNHPDAGTPALSWGCQDIDLFHLDGRIT